MSSSMPESHKVSISNFSITALELQNNPAMFPTPSPPLMIWPQRRGYISLNQTCPFFISRSTPLKAS